VRSYLLEEKAIRIIDDSEDEDDTAVNASADSKKDKKKSHKLND
jgi:hypothetical protein